MSGIFGTIIAGITTFSATNIDDIFILILFFSQLNSTFRTQHIVLGKYLGFAAIILASLPGFFGGLIVPKAWIGLLGILPIMIGINHFFKREEEKTEVQEVSNELTLSSSSRFTSLFNPQTYHVAAVTFANGGDNIGIYVPLFANSNLIQLGIILSIFMVLIAVWCLVAYWLTRHPAIAHLLTQYGNAIVPFILIALGISILIESETYKLLPFWK